MFGNKPLIQDLYQDRAKYNVHIYDEKQIGISKPTSRG
jgi:hypothetical protein